MATKIGITFSHPHLQHLKLPVLEALDLALTMGFSHLRLGSYWSEIENEKDIYDFSTLQEILTKCEKVNQKVILTVGVKAPRWPEFYWPKYLPEKDFNNKIVQEKLLHFIEITVLNFQKYSCLTHWQVENEPLGPSGPDQKTIPLAFLAKEAAVVKSIDTRPILINVWTDYLKKSSLFKHVCSLADIVGLDIYYKQYVASLLGKSIYKGPLLSETSLQKLIRNSVKPVMITELQAEPWEKNEQGYLSDNPPSISPKIIEDNIKRTANLGVTEILLWGFEYWYYRMVKGDTGYIKTIKKYL